MRLCPVGPPNPALQRTGGRFPAFEWGGFTGRPPLNCAFGGELNSEFRFFWPLVQRKPDVLVARCCRSNNHHAERTNR
jgi:hypothetical protein